MIVSACILLFCIAVAWATIHDIRQPALRLVEAIHAMEYGNYTPALTLTEKYPTDRKGGRNELHTVAGTFGRMAGTIASREARLAADNRLATILASSLDPRHLAAGALRETLNSTGFMGGAIYLLEPEKDKLRLVAAVAMEELPEWLPATEGIFGQALEGGASVLIHEGDAALPGRINLEGAAREPKFLGIAVLAFHGHAIGAMLLGGNAEPDADAMAFIEHAGRHLSVSLENARTHRDATGLAEELGIKNKQLELQNEMLHAQSRQLQTQSEQLQAQNEEIQARNEALRRQARELAEADRRKDEFLAMLAHELRNPLAAISNANLVLERGVVNPEKTARMRSMVTRQVRHLSRMVNDLLDVSRITWGKVELRKEVASLNQLVRSAVDASRGFIENMQHEFTVSLLPEDARVEADPTRMEQMICNLLFNAAKYTDPHGRICLTVEREGDWATIRVRDSGIGIAPEMLSHVFELFAQAESGPDRAKGGLGIGLTMVRGLAEMHGGKVEAHSAGIGQGSEFVIHLPILNAAGLSGGVAEGAA